MVVFKIQNKVTQQHYVGSCRSDIFERWELYVRAAEAGLDFPLYREIREHGEAAFAITELDFAEDIAELKEMELLHTVELCARSLRGYKFGRSDVVVKRCRQADLNNAWMKDLPETDRPDAAPPARIKTQKAAAPAQQASQPAVAPVAGPVASEPPAVPPQQRQAAPAPARPRETPSAPPQPAPQSRQASPPAAEPATAGGELDESLFAEGVGLLVRTLGCFEQLDQQRQQADRQSRALSRALTASSQALAALEHQQCEALERARQAQAAVEASREANRMLSQAQGEVQACADTVLTLLGEAGSAAEEMGALQQGVIALLGRLKRTGARGEAAGHAGRDVRTSVPAAPVPSRDGDDGQTPQRRVDAAREKTLDPGGPAACAGSPPVPDQEPEVDPRELAAQEARMVNGLKGLDKLLAAAKEGQDEAEVLEQPVRAWVAGDRNSQAPQVLEKKPSAATVVHRRARPLENGHTRPGRRTLSIRAR